METYWREQLEVLCETYEPQPSGSQDNSSDLIATEYNCLQLSQLLPNNDNNGWEAELHQYLKDFPQNVTKDMDIVLWWQVRI